MYTTAFFVLFQVLFPMNPAAGSRPKLLYGVKTLEELNSDWRRSVQKLRRTSWCKWV